MEIHVTSRHYTLTEEYVDKEGKLKIASVKLVVDEAQQKFEVFPGDGMGSFTYTSRTKADYAKWAAVAKLGYMAVEFGIKELKLEIKNPKELQEIPFPETASNDK